MATLGSAFVNIRANLAPLRRGLALARTAVTGAMRGISSVMHTVARVIRRVMLLATAAITGVIYAAVQFEKQMAMVSTMLSSKMIPTMEKYKRSLVDMSKKFGQTTDTLAKGLYNILSATIAPAMAIKVLGVATKMAIAGITDTATATKSLVAVLNSYGMEASDANVVSDKLFAALKRGLFTFEEFAGAIGKSAATAALGGVKFEELLAVITTTTRSGVQIDETMTAINSTIMAFLKPSKEGAEAAKKFGIELSSTFLKEKGLVAAILALNKASAEEVMQLIQNRRAFKAMAASLKDVTGLTSDLEFITKGATGETEKAYRKMSATAMFSIHQTIQSLGAMAKKLGTPMLKPLMRLLHEFRRVFDNIETWAKKNASEIKYWSDVVVDKMQDAIWYVEDLYNVMKSPRGGIGAALKAVFEDIKEGLAKSLEFIIAKGPAIGEAIGEGFLRKINLLGRLKDWGEEKIGKPLAGAAGYIAEGPAKLAEEWRETSARRFKLSMLRETLARRIPPGEEPSMGAFHHLRRRSGEGYLEYKMRDLGNFLRGQKQAYAQVPGGLLGAAEWVGGAATYPARALAGRAAEGIRTGVQEDIYQAETLRILNSIDRKMDMDRVD